MLPPVTTCHHLNEKGGDRLNLKFAIRNVRILCFVTTVTTYSITYYLGDIDIWHMHTYPAHAHAYTPA